MDWLLGLIPGGGLTAIIGAVLAGILHRWLAGETAAYVERVTIALEPLADMARIRADLMQHQKNGLSGGITA